MFGAPFGAPFGMFGVVRRSCTFTNCPKIDFSAKNSKKFVYYNEELVTNSKFQTQLSRKLQRFRTCRKNKKCSIFHDLSEYIIFHMIVTYWTGPLSYFNNFSVKVFFYQGRFISPHMVLFSKEYLPTPNKSKNEKLALKLT